MTETTVFQSGNSQAVRLPKEFRFKSKTVEIFRRGDEVVLREKPRTLGDVLRSLPPITAEEAEEIRLMFEDVRETRPPEERNWAALWGEAVDPSEPVATRPTVAAADAPKKRRTTGRRKT
jgi:antitoxin VapB